MKSSRAGVRRASAITRRLWRSLGKANPCESGDFWRVQGQQRGVALQRGDRGRSKGRRTGEREREPENAVGARLGASSFALSISMLASTSVRFPSSAVLSAAISIPLSAIALWKTRTSCKAITKAKTDAVEAQSRLNDAEIREQAADSSQKISFVTQPR